MVLQERDIAVLRGLFESRVMTSAHVAALYFHGKAEAAKKRLQKLKAASLIRERRRRAYEAATLYLTRVGHLVLQRHGILREYPAMVLDDLEKRARVGEFTVRHELEVMDVKAAFHAALRTNATFSVAEFGTWPRLYQFEALGSRNGTMLVKPDGFIRIHEREKEGGLSEHSFFLELDRSTEILDRLVSRGNHYLDYYRSGEFAVRNGGSRSAYKDYPFRVLMVFKTAERRSNVAERLLQNTPPILTQIYLTTIEEVRIDPLGAIWVRPIDHQTAVFGTPFDPEKRRARPEYQREPAREAFIVQKVKKVRLLEN